MRTLYAGGWIVTCDDAGTEHPSGWVLVEGDVVAAVGTSDEPEADARVDLAGAVVTPGLVNTHHHLYQTLTRARAQQADLFNWLRELEPGKCADLAVWRTDVLELAGAEDPVAGLVFSARHRADRLVVGGEDVVRGGALVRADEVEIARAQRLQARRFAA